MGDGVGFKEGGEVGIIVGVAVAFHVGNVDGGELGTMLGISVGSGVGFKEG